MGNPRLAQNSRRGQAKCSSVPGFNVLILFGHVSFRQKSAVMIPWKISIRSILHAKVLNPGRCLERDLNSPHSSAELILFNDRATLGVRWHLELNAITSATPSPQGEVLFGRPLLFLSPPGSRLLVTSYLLLVPDPQRSLFLCLHPLLHTLLPSHNPFCH